MLPRSRIQEAIPLHCWRLRGRGEILSRFFGANEAPPEGRFRLSCCVVPVPFSWSFVRDRRDTVSTPFPKQLETSGLNRAYSAFVSCLEDIPSMLEVSLRWSLASFLAGRLVGWLACLLVFSRKLLGCNQERLVLDPSSGGTSCTPWQECRVQQTRKTNRFGRLYLHLLRYQELRNCCSPRLVLRENSCLVRARKSSASSKIAPFNTPRPSPERPLLCVHRTIRPTALYSWCVFTL